MDESPAAIAREAFSVLTITAGPFLVAVLIVGVIVGVLQAATQVNDPAVSFLPRALVGLAVAWAFGPLALDKLAAFFVSAATRMAGAGP
jgi:flagellar biosynthesis protein FliQ